MLLDILTTHVNSFEDTKNDGTRQATQDDYDKF